MPGRDYINNSRRFQTVQDSSRRFQAVPDGSRWFQVVPYRWFQLGGSRRFQMVPDGSAAESAFSILTRMVSVFWVTF